MYGTATPYTASYAIVRKADKIAFVLRKNTTWMNGYYGLPSGKVEKAESFDEAVIREVAEEVGLQVDANAIRFAHLMHRYNPAEDMTWADAYFEIDSFEGEPYNAEPDVHGELAWFALDNLPENVIPSVRFALERIEQGFVYTAYGWHGDVPEEV